MKAAQPNTSTVDAVRQSVDFTTAQNALYGQAFGQNVNYYPSTGTTTSYNAAFLTR